MMYEHYINPPCNFWADYQLPKLCKSKIEEICKDILNNGESTKYNDIYHSIYELVLESIGYEADEGSYYE